MNRPVYIDSHAHLFGKDFAGDMHETIVRAEDAGIQFIVVPGVDVETSAEAVRLSDKYRCVRACVGVHPHEASRMSDRVLSEVEALLSHPNVVAVGEIGLDFHYDFSPRDSQIGVFREQMDLAARNNLPVVIHTRESLAETMDVVDATIGKAPRWNPRSGSSLKDRSIGRGVFHCFGGSAAEAERLRDKGFFVSYPGIVTFKKSEVISVLRQIGYENILLETDSPYMAPVPFRGKRNEPANIVHIGRFIASALNISEAEVAESTSANAKWLFNLGGPD